MSYMEQQRLTYLLQQYGNNQVTQVELEELRHFLASGEGGEVFTEAMAGLMTTYQDRSFDIAPYLDLSKKVLEIDKAPIPVINMTDVRCVHFLKTAWFRYAAVIILFLGIGAWFWGVNRKNNQLAANHDKTLNSAITPGKNGAVLTLADGRQLVLDSLKNGVIANQNGAQAVLHNGSLVYHTGSQASDAIVYNSISTNKGRQFQLVLPDGSKVWLNAASAIRYPTVFTGKERVVEITGEAYFEVTKNKAMPFRVKAGSGTTVEVLGTSFNINAYDNEAAVATTLLEGAVNIHASLQTQMLTPGEQAQVRPGEKINVVENADIDKTMAWKNGYFNFNNTGLQVMMRQLERWYDIQVMYEGNIPDVIFQGKMDRLVQLSDVVRFLTIFGIKTRLEGRTLIISGN